MSDYQGVTPPPGDAGRGPGGQGLGGQGLGGQGLGGQGPGGHDAAGHTGPPPKAPAQRTLIVILTMAIVLLLGIIIGIVISNRDSAQGDQGSTTGTAGSATDPAATAEGSAAATPDPTASPTLTEEQQQEVLDLIRAQPRRDPDDPLAMGEVDAPVVLIEYADFRCHYCGQFSLETRPGLMSLVDDGTLRIEWRDFPVFQEESVDLAVAARAAGEQGLFWEYNDAVFTYQFVDGKKDFSAEPLAGLAQQVGVPDPEQFAADVAGEELRAAVQAEYQATMALLGQASTPQFLINDQYVGGAKPLADFEAVIAQELAKVQG